MPGLTKEQLKEKEIEREQKLRDEIRRELEKELKLSDGATSTKPKSKKIPLDLEVPVINTHNGKLIFTSKKSNGYSVEWDEHGMTEYMELGELLSMRNTDKRFFEENWIVLGDTDDYTSEELYKFLKVDKLYKNIFSPHDFDEFFKKSPEEMIKIIGTLSKGIRASIASKAQEMIINGTLDSNKKIEALSAVLNVEFFKE